MFFNHQHFKNILNNYRRSCILIFFSILNWKMQHFYDITLELDLLWFKPPKTFSKLSHISHILLNVRLGYPVFLSVSFDHKGLCTVFLHTADPCRQSEETALLVFRFAVFAAFIWQQLHKSIFLFFFTPTPFGWFVALFSLLQSDGWWWDLNALEGFYWLWQEDWNNKWEDWS